MGDFKYKKFDCGRWMQCSDAELRMDRVEMRPADEELRTPITFYARILLNFTNAVKLEVARAGGGRRSGVSERGELVQA